MFWWSKEKKDDKAEIKRLRQALETAQHRTTAMQKDIAEIGGKWRAAEGKAEEYKTRQQIAEYRLQIAQREYRGLDQAYDEMAEAFERYRRNNPAGKQNQQAASSQFTNEEIKALIRLCHPDKHGGKEIANTITQKLLSLRK